MHTIFEKVGLGARLAKSRVMALMMLLMVFLVASVASAQEAPTLDLDMTGFIESLFGHIESFMPLATQVFALPLGIQIAFLVVAVVGGLLVAAFLRMRSGMD